MQSVMAVWSTCSHRHLFRSTSHRSGASSLSFLRWGVLRLIGPSFALVVFHHSMPPKFCNAPSFL
eukprot:366568-Chlamydomonas_euryale.AAC.7